MKFMRACNLEQMRELSTGAGWCGCSVRVLPNHLIRPGFMALLLNLSATHCHLDPHLMPIAAAILFGNKKDTATQRNPPDVGSYTRGR